MENNQPAKNERSFTLKLMLIGFILSLLFVILPLQAASQESSLSEDLVPMNDLVPTVYYTVNAIIGFFLIVSLVLVVISIVRLSKIKKQMGYTHDTNVKDVNDDQVDKGHLQKRRAKMIILLKVSIIFSIILLSMLYIISPFNIT